MALQHENKIALVTGASRGIGQAIARELARQGATVIGTATTDANAATISAMFDQEQLNGVGKVLDVTDGAAIEALIEELSKEGRAPQILVNNAGITRDNLLLRMEDDEWDAVMNTNLASVYRLSKVCLRAMMRARWGRIINIGSVVGLSGNAGQSNYCAAKAGLIGFSKSLAQEMGSRNVTVNVVAPGFIDTDMTRQLPDAQREALLAAIPLRRLGQCEDIAAAVSFLASEAGAYITGETLNVNGGMYMS